MGFPAAYHCIVIPRALLNLAFALAYLNNGLCWFFSWLGLPEVIQPYEYSWPEFSEISPDISSDCVSDMIRQRLPVIRFGERVSEMEEEIFCTVCLSSFEEEDQIRLLCNCSHIFHRDCLDKWIDHHHKNCPLCRCPLLPRPAKEDGGEGKGNDNVWIVNGISYIFGEDSN
ncbi:hypothetical protein SUGI_1190420 [Cryptomeria japonica]|nr:hypothetical protein SUGI_1190420 [Cryptomeria japonica]